jgi:dihydroorotate dehydrogenase
MLGTLYPLIRPILFSLEAERAHEWTLQAVSTAPGMIGALSSAGYPPQNNPISTSVFGLPIPSPVGLAAGLDKNGIAIPYWPSLGFGFVEVGTVTAIPQKGNEKPRLFRVPEDKALINRMGFNNRGSEQLALTMKSLRESGRWPNVPVGANVGKSKVTPLEDAPQDYALSISRLQPFADYFTINVSSPNTPGLRSLQHPESLKGILDASLIAAKDTPVAVKLAPDLNSELLAAIVELVISSGVSAIIATNTTIQRKGLSQPIDQTGGLSGRPLWPIARSIIKEVLQAANGKVPVIGCGGIHKASHVEELLSMGCAAIQLYSALIFDGPGLPSTLNRNLCESRRSS